MVEVDEPCLLHVFVRAMGCSLATALARFEMAQEANLKSLVASSEI